MYKLKYVLNYEVKMSIRLSIRSILDSQNYSLRKDLEQGIFTPLGGYMFRRTYRMTKVSFYKLHGILSSHLDYTPFLSKNSDKRGSSKCVYHFYAQVPLSIGRKYFAGRSLYEIMITHGVSYKSIFISIWGVVDDVNCTKELELSFS